MDLRWTPVAPSVPIESIVTSNLWIATEYVRIRASVAFDSLYPGFLSGRARMRGACSSIG